MKQKITVNGKPFSSIEDWAEQFKHNPESDTLFWDYKHVEKVVNGKIESSDGHPATGKC